MSNISTSRAGLLRSTEHEHEIAKQVQCTVLTSTMYSTDQYDVQYWLVQCTVLTSTCYSTDLPSIDLMLHFYPTVKGIEKV